jgi:hypothetical protein
MAGLSAQATGAADGMVAMADLINGGLPYITAVAINDESQIGGSFVIAPGRYGGYVWNPSGGITILPSLTQDAREVQGVQRLSDAGHALGISIIPGEEDVYCPFVWDQRHGIRHLQASLDPCRLAAYERLTYAMDINANGWIVATFGQVDLLPAALLIPYIPGDLDENEICDLQDLAIQLSNFSREGDAEYEHGDLDCDQDVDLQDLAILLGNFGESLP